jgi:hypothetical protein
MYWPEWVLLLLLLFSSWPVAKKEKKKKKIAKYVLLMRTLSTLQYKVKGLKEVYLVFLCPLELPRYTVPKGL